MDSNRATFIDRVEGDETQVTVFLTVEEYYGDGLGESYSSQRTVRMVHEDGWKIDELLVGLEPGRVPGLPGSAIGDEPMQTVRRLYLYLMSGISLGVLLVGLNILLTVVLHALGIGRGELLGGSESDRQALSLAAALIVVGLLVWGVHWLLVERSLRPDNPQRDAERGAGERALYFTLVLAVLLVFGVLAGTQLVEELTTGSSGARRGRLLQHRPRRQPGDGDGHRISLGLPRRHPPTRPARRTAHRAREPGCRGSTSTVPRWRASSSPRYNISTLLGTGVLALSGRVPDMTSATSASARPRSPLPGSSAGPSSGLATGGTPRG